MKFIEFIEKLKKKKSANELSSEISKKVVDSLEKKFWEYWSKSKKGFVPEVSDIIHWVLESNESCKWISVQDRLPEIGTQVIRYDTLYGIGVSQLSEDIGGRLTWAPGFLYPTGAPHEVVAWMPLPEYNIKKRI